MASEYAEFVRNNAKTIGSIESSVRSLTYILPGRFEGAEILSEGLYALTGLAGHGHDAILAKEARRQQPQTPISAFNRYTLSILKSSNLVNSLSILLTTINTFEVFCEMIALKCGGKKLRSKTILTVESLKVICRLLLMSLNGDRMQLHSPMPDREYDTSRLLPADEVEGSCWVGKRTGSEHIPVATLSGKTGSERAMQFLQSCAITDPSASPIHLVPRLTGLRKLGELIYILRPLLYVLAIRNYGIRSYKPWVMSLVLELGSFGLLSGWAQPDIKRSLTELERDEMKRRMYLFTYYLLRTPFYEKYTKERLTSIGKSLSTKPILSILGNAIQDYVPLWETYHFYTSPSVRR
ncbi:hypothetical protein BASA61_001319 [Batrachochytrium salamandrivorans]|nr:hypothetical protein BASA60_007855 [Batrachochytrium salamandrivorans]KAH6574938.1 hypothetical protein BASA62_002198 [Batrachochytrium salamandrivorans]KAH6602261.1 hypothetical protein BASA61_001319 [Batrachochytrium salamandrivorans]KAH9247147.1 hypothetical protein BASA81_015257 [Batrachochytrium salamandrivorans]KAH9274576.1 hypothetical protein BASA83_003212 [Batrachochytrium salamandrivorans]